jgi:hypothetical protein
MHGELAHPKTKDSAQIIIFRFVMPKTHKKAAQFLSANFTLDQGCVNLRAPKTTFDGLYSIVYSIFLHFTSLTRELL